MLPPRSKHGVDFRILLVEDNPHDVELARTIFQLHLVCQVTAVTTKAAFEAELEHSAPDLILSDSNLPGFSGLAALALTKQKRPASPFVFCTGHPKAAAKAEALAHGAADYISKDDVLKLVAVIQRFCRHTGL